MKTKPCTRQWQTERVDVLNYKNNSGTLRFRQILRVEASRINLKAGLFLKNRTIRVSQFVSWFTSADLSNHKHNVTNIHVFLKRAHPDTLTSWITVLCYTRKVFVMKGRTCSCSCFVMTESDKENIFLQYSLLCTGSL